MSGGPGAPAPELELVRREYESSLSWRITAPLRAAAKRARSLRAANGSTAPTRAPKSYDAWLDPVYGELLRGIDAACVDAGPEAFALFRGLDVELWALLLTREYDAYPNIRALLPDVPEPALQQLWNGASGARLAEQSRAFYTRLLERYDAHASRPLAEARVLDFGCGWGRLTRYLARDVAPGNLYGCDPVEDILEVCRRSRVPATLARSDFVPDGLPFDGPFDLAFSFSVFTHLSEWAHERSLDALHAALAPGGLLVLTIRPPHYLWFCELMHPALEALGDAPAEALEQPRYLFVPHPAEPSHYQWIGGEMTYGETVITLPYARERWAARFEVLDVDMELSDLYQLVVTLRRR